MTRDEVLNRLRERAKKEGWSIDHTILMTWRAALAWGIEDYDDPALSGENGT